MGRARRLPHRAPVSRALTAVSRRHSLPSTKTPAPEILTWLHIGDLHLKEPEAANRRDFMRIVGLVAALPPGSLDFVLLPGDNADDGTPEQYCMVRDGLAPLPLPVHILPGDHDMAPGNLDAFYSVLGARRLPFASTIAGHRCLFLDVVSAGTGGPDFRLGHAQLDWIEREVADAAAAAQTAAIFMHTYPADLREGAERLGALLARPHVACVDMGHTHYNELANDGGTIFMATRSTGQIEEGPAGFSIAAIDGGCVSWRFKELEAPWPLVLITRPADTRLTTRASADASPALVRAKVLGDAAITAVEVQADDGPWRPMHLSGAAWEARLDAPARRIAVRATDAAGRTDADAVEPPADGFTPPDRAPDGSDRHSIGAWPEKGIVGGQLGPNRNGRKW